MNANDFYKQLNTGTISGAYLFHGEDEFFKLAALRNAEYSIPEEIRAFNLNTVNNATLETIVSCCETLPVMNPFSLVIVRELASKIDAKALIDYIPRLPMDTVLIIAVSGKLDAKSALLKAFAQMGREVYFQEPSEYDAAKWCVFEANRRGVMLHDNTARAFIGKVGTDMSFVNNELTKLIDLVGEGGTITPQTVSFVSISNIDAEVFDAINCFTYGKVREGMRSLGALVESEGDCTRIVGALLASFKRILTARSLLDTGLDVKSAAAKMDGKPYGNEKACAIAKKYSFDALAELVGRLSLVIFNERSGGADAKSALGSIMMGFDWK